MKVGIMKVTTALSSNILNQAAGVFFYAKNTSRYLYLLRNDDKNNTWSIPGGKVEKDETLLDGIARECIEELGFFDNDWKLIPIQKFVNKKFVYHTFFCQIPDEFIPDLNIEHTGYAWVKENLYPKPLHPGLFSTVNIDIVVDKLKQLEK